MNITAQTTYGNFACSVVATLNVDIVGAEGEEGEKSVKLATLALRKGLASELYRAGNSAMDKVFAPKKENEDGEEVPVLKGFKRETVDFTVERAATVKKTLEKALADSFNAITVSVTEHVKGEQGSTRKLATAFYEKQKAAGKLEKLAAVLEFDGDVNDREAYIEFIHENVIAKS